MRKQKAIILFLLISVLLFTACSPQKRLERLLKRYPELLAHDTVIKEALVPIPSKTATFSLDYRLRDSMISIKGADSIELTYAVLNDSVIEVIVYVPPDTIEVPVSVPVDRIKYIKPDNWGMFIEKIPYIALVILLLLVAGLILKK